MADDQAKAQAAWAEQRRQMVGQLMREADGLASQLLLPAAAFSARVLAALGAVPRHEFLAPEWRHLAYADMALPGDCGKTISQPLLVALMSELLGLQGHERVLEIGTGMGYQTAVLSRLAGEVFSVELIPRLAEAARQRLAGLAGPACGTAPVHSRCGDGRLGWPEAAPFDALLCTAGADRLPPAFVDQLKPGGRLVMPLGEPWSQRLVLGIKQADGRLALQKGGGLPVVFSLLQAPADGEGGAP